MAKGKEENGTARIFITRTNQDTEDGGRVVYGPVANAVEFLYQHGLGDGLSAIQTRDPKRGGRDSNNI